MIRFTTILIAFVVAALPLRAAVPIQEVKSPGGITAWLVEEHSIPFIALELRFRGGASLDAPGKRGAIHLMSALLEEGAGEMDAQAFSIATESLAAEFEFDAYDDSVSIGAKFLTENADEALELLRLALTETRFDDDAVERVRAQVISIIESDAKDPDTISGRAFDELAFGDHPYGTALEGTVESVEALTREDMFAARDRVLARDRLYVSAVGDIDPDALGTMLDTLLGGLPETGAPMPEAVEFGLGGGVTVVPYETPQSVVTFGHGGIARDDEDFFAAYIMMQIFGGGGFGNRLMEEVREKRGLTYGIGAYLYPLDLSSMTLGRVATVNDRVAETIEVVRAEWQKLAENGVTQEELERAKTYLTGAYPLRFDGNRRIANILVGMQMEGLPIDYAATRNDKVEAVTLEDVRRIAKRMIDPEGLHFVVVGQPVGVENTN